MRGTIGVLAAALVMTGAQVSSAAAEDHAAPRDPDVPIIVTSPMDVGGTTLQGSQVVLSGQQVIVNQTSLPLTPQCTTSVPGLPPTQSVCVGSTQSMIDAQTHNPYGHIEVVSGGLHNENPDGPNLQWLEDEAVNALMVIHGVIDPDIVRSYFRPEMRAYIHMRLIDIMNKRLYGEQMTAQEAQTYQEVMTYLQERELRKAKQTLAEYKRWEADPCTYTPPAPPSDKFTDYQNTADIPANCGARSQLVELFQFTKYTPSVEAFQAWASYRHPTPMMKELKNPALSQALINTTAGYGVLAGLGAAAAAGLGLGLFITSSASLAAAVVSATGIASFAIAHGSITAAAAGSIGAGLAATIFAIVVLAIVIAAVSIWMLVEESKIPAAINERVSKAAQNTDPLGIDAAAPLYAGLDYATLEQPANPPTLLHLQSAFNDQLFELTHEWTMFNRVGQFVPDPETGYTGVASTGSDIKFRDSHGDLKSEVVAQAVDASASGTPVSGHKVHFSKGFLMAAPATLLGVYGPAKPTASIPFLNHDGAARRMSIVQVRDASGKARRAFLIVAPGQAEDQGVVTDTWETKGVGGVDQTYTLEENPPVTPPLSIVPTLKGTLLPGNLLTFEAHSNRPGEFTGGKYSWTIQRLDSSGNPVETFTRTEAENLVAFQHRFTTPGPYRATVRFAGTESGTPFDVRGDLDFTLDVPRPEVIHAALVDNRVDDGRLFLDLRLEQQTPGDTFDVSVEWADDNNGHKSVVDYTVTCRDFVVDDYCETDPLNAGPPDAPTNANWSSSPSFELPEDAQFLPFVTMTVTNSYGVSIKQAFPIMGEHRARYADRTPYIRMEIGKFNRVKVTDVTASTLEPNATIDVLPYVDEIAAQLPAGLTPDLQDVGPPGGTYELQLRGTPESADIGLYTFYFPVAQYPQHPAGDPAPAQVVLDIVPSVDPGFRAILSNVPTGGSFDLYRTGFPPFAVQVAYETPPGHAAADDPDYEGVVTCHLENAGQVVFDKPCAVGQDFPWPAGEPDGDWLASVVAGPSGTDTVNTAKYQTTFVTRVLRPTLSRDPVAADALQQPVRLGIVDFLDATSHPIAPPFSSAGYGTTCRIDGATAYKPCLDKGSMQVTRTPGAHSVQARVAAPDGAVVVRTLTWVVATPPAKLTVKTPQGTWRAGTKEKVKLAAFLPGEHYKLFLGGKLIDKGVVALNGKAELRIRIPDAVAPGKHVLMVRGEVPRRKGRTTVHVLARG